MRHKTAALVDPLTGIANRRAFLEDVAALSKRQAPRRGRWWCCSPISITSSRSTTASATPSATVCCRFSPSSAAAKLGPSDLIGRLGGEEFAIVLYDAGREKGHAIAERIRLRVRGRRGRCRRPRGRRHRQHGHGGGGGELFDIPALLGRADEALYCAKERGRNRVEIASLHPAVPERTRGIGQPTPQAAPQGAA